MNKKKQILDKTEELLFKIGVKSTTMDDISHEIGISKKTLYDYFPTKEALVRETLQSYFTKIDQIINSINKKNVNAVEKFFTIIENTTSTVSFDEVENRLINIKKYYPEIFEEIQLKQLKIIQNNFRKIILQGILEGLFREDFDLNLFIKFYYIGAINMCGNTLFEGTNMSYKFLKIKYLEFYIRSISTAKGIEKIEEIIPS